MLNKQLRRELPYMIFVLAFVAFLFWDHRNLEKSLQRPTVNIEQVVIVEQPKGELVEPASDVEAYIQRVFGEHYPKAMLLLKGTDSKSCAENRTLRQDAVNYNWVKGKPGVWWSRDVGIFQINDAFHPVSALNLDTDWKANVDYAFRAFSNDGYTFSKRWVCGKWYKSQGYEI